MVPRWALTRRLYSLIPAKMKLHHHLKIKHEMRMDLLMWREFLSHPSVFSRPFTDFSKSISATELNLYTDLSRNFKLGCEGIFYDKWFIIAWDEFTARVKPSIQYLELFAVAVVVKLWARYISNHRVILFCANQVAVAMINSASSSCKNCMVLSRIIALESLIHNVKISAKFIRSLDNGKADALSRMNLTLFRKLAP